jgi:hypothetical protein
MRHKPWTVRTLCLEGIKRPQGIAARDLPCCKATAFKNLRLLQSEGLAFPAGHHKDWRYFDTAERAAKFVPPVKPRRVTSVAPTKEVTFRIAKPRREGWGPDDPCVITPQTKFTYAPAPVRCLRTNTHSH